MTRSPDELARLIHYMPLIVRSGGVSDWERKFCASIIAKSRRGKFTPSEKQAGVMSRLVKRFQEATMRDDGEVIDQ